MPTQRLARRFGTGSCIALVIFAACARSAPVAPLVPPSGADRAFHGASASGLDVVVWPYVPPARAVGGATAIFPIAIVLENRGASAVRLRRGDLALELEGGSLLSATDARYASVALADIDSVPADARGGGFPCIGPGCGALLAGVIAIALVGFVASELLVEKAPRAAGPSEEELAELAAEMTLEPGASTRGIVFFVAQPGTWMIEHATLRVPFRATQKIDGEAILVSVTKLEALRRVDH